MFFRLRRRKGATGFGIPPLEWPDIDAFARMTRQYISPWEIGIIEALDDLYLAEKAKSKQP